MMEHISNSNWLTKPQKPLVSISFYDTIAQNIEWWFSATDLELGRPAKLCSVKNYYS